MLIIMYTIALLTMTIFGCVIIGLRRRYHNRHRAPFLQSPPPLPLRVLPPTSDTSEPSAAPQQNDYVIEEDTTSDKSPSNGSGSNGGYENLCDAKRNEESCSGYLVPDCDTEEVKGRPSTVNMRQKTGRNRKGDPT